MTGRRRRDGERTPDDTAPATRRAPGPGRVGDPGGRRPRPDGSIVDPNPPATTPTRPPRGGVPAGDPAEAASGAAAGAGSPPRPRVRPRRIPGAPGSVLVTPTLRPEAADGREERRRRRAGAPSASVTPLPPRPPAPDADAHDAAPARLRPVGHGRAPVSGRGARRPTPAHPGEPRRQRVLAAMSGLTLDRLLPADYRTLHASSSDPTRSAGTGRHQPSKTPAARTRGSAAFDTKLPATGVSKLLRYIPG